MVAAFFDTQFVCVLFVCCVCSTDLVAVGSNIINAEKLKMFIGLSCFVVVKTVKSINSIHKNCYYCY